MLKDVQKCDGEKFWLNSKTSLFLYYPQEEKRLLKNWNYINDKKFTNVQKKTRKL